jgi:hypothetical protein
MTSILFNQMAETKDRLGRLAENFQELTICEAIALHVRSRFE